MAPDGIAQITILSWGGLGTRLTEIATLGPLLLPGLARPPQKDCPKTPEGA